MEFLQLRYFMESAENESFSKAAEKYQVPATSVSAAIKRLERELGCPLFRRSYNSIALNEKGRLFLESVRIAFEALDGAVEKLSSSIADTREIKLLVRAMRDKITDHIIEYKQKNPHISFKTVFDFESTDYEDYDIIIDEKTEKYRGYECVDLYHAIVRLYVSKSNPLYGKKYTLQQLSAQPFISIGEKNGLHNILVSACKRVGFSPNIVVRSNDVQCIKKCVEAGVGIGLCREFLGAKQSKRVEYLSVTDFKEKQTVCCYFRAQSAYGNVAHFLKFLQSKAP